jgi:hypothetical protein
MRKSATYFVLVAICTVAIAGCGAGNSLFKGLYNTPTPMPSPVISSVPTSLTFSSTSKGPDTLTITESNGNTFFTATTTDATVATVAAQLGSSNIFSVTATGKVGTCKIQISDGEGDTLDVAVTTN